MNNNAAIARKRMLSIVMILILALPLSSAPALADGENGTTFADDAAIMPEYAVAFTGTVDTPLLLDIALGEPVQEALTKIEALVTPEQNEYRAESAYGDEVRTTCIKWRLTDTDDRPYELHLYGVDGAVVGCSYMYEYSPDSQELMDDIYGIYNAINAVYAADETADFPPLELPEAWPEICLKKLPHAEWSPALSLRYSVSARGQVRIEISIGDMT